VIKTLPKRRKVMKLELALEDVSVPEDIPVESREKYLKKNKLLIVNCWLEPTDWSAIKYETQQRILAKLSLGNQTSYETGFTMMAFPAPIYRLLGNYLNEENVEFIYGVKEWKMAPISRFKLVGIEENTLIGKCVLPLAIREDLDFDWKTLKVDIETRIIDSLDEIREGIVNYVSTSGLFSDLFRKG